MSNLIQRTATFLNSSSPARIRAAANGPWPDPARAAEPVTPLGPRSKWKATTLGEVAARGPGTKFRWPAWHRDELAQRLSAGEPYEGEVVGEANKINFTAPVCLHYPEEEGGKVYRSWDFDVQVWVEEP